MHPLEYSILAIAPFCAICLTVLARYYGWDEKRIYRMQWTVFEGVLSLFILGGSLALGVLVGGAVGALVSAGFVLVLLAFLVVHYRVR